MRHRRLTGAVLLGASLLLGAEEAQGQQEEAPPRTVIATSVPVTTEAPAAPAQLPPNLPAAPLSRPAPAAPSAVQQAAFVPGTPPPAAPPGGAADRRIPTNGLIQESPAPTPPVSAPAPPAAQAAPAAPPPPLPSAAAPATGLMSGLSAPTPPAPQPSNPLGMAPLASAALVSVDVAGPERAALGAPLPHEIIVRNSGARPAAEVRVEEALPAGARVLRAEPPGTVQGDRIAWNLGTLAAGTERRLKVEVQPTAPGEVRLRPCVTFADNDGLRTEVVRPQFAVEMTADRDKVPRDGRITFTIRLANNGETLIHNIKVFDPLPPNLRHPAGTNVGITHFGDLQPGEARSVKLETTAVKAGRFRNEITAQADGGVEGRAAVEGEVMESTLSLRLNGPKQGITQRDLDFTLEVSNPSPSPAAKVRLVQALPPSFEGIAASTGGSFDPATHAFTWTLTDLGPGQRQIVTFRVRAGAGGDWPLYSAVLADNLPETRAANILRIEGAPALTLEVHAREDRLDIGGETVYELHVFNQGDAPCAGIRLSATLPDEVTPLDAQGPMAGQVQQQQVRFPPLAQLPPRGDAVYRIRVRGQQAGKGRVRVELTAEREKPVESDLSIQVNGGSAAPTGTVTVGHTTPTPIQELR